MLDPRTGEQFTTPTEEEQEAITGGTLSRTSVPRPEGGDGTLPDTKLFWFPKPGLPVGPPETHS